VKKKKNFSIEYHYLNLFRVDADHNKYLSKEELFNYVLRNVQLHLKKAKDKNSQLFLLIDTNQNGKIQFCFSFLLN
jgi:Ca2+-binding EF-hand superfamily protein